MLAIDATGGDVRSHAGGVETGRRAAEWAREGEERGAGEILLTSIDTDGTRDGYDLELTEEVAARRLGAGDRLRRRRLGRPRRRRARGRPGGAARVDPAREPRPPGQSLRDELRGLGVPLRDAA